MLMFVAGIASFLVASNCGKSKKCRQQDDRLDALEKRLAEKEPAPKTDASKKRAVPKDEGSVPVPGAAIQINMVEEAPDEVYRDMTVVSSTTNPLGEGCRFTHLGEEITVLEVRDRYALVQYERHIDAKEVAAWRQRWFYRTDPPFCADGDIGVMSLHDFEMDRYGAESDSIVRREQREEVARIRTLFPELSALPAEGP